MQKIIGIGRPNRCDEIPFDGLPAKNLNLSVPRYGLTSASPGGSHVTATDELSERLAHVRARFASALDGKIADGFAALEQMSGDGETAEIVVAAHRRLHELCGIAPTLGFMAPAKPPLGRSRDTRGRQDQTHANAGGDRGSQIETRSPAEGGGRGTASLFQSRLVQAPGPRAINSLAARRASRRVRPRPASSDRTVLESRRPRRARENVRPRAAAHARS